MPASRLRAPLLASGAGLLIALGFPDSLGLWPLRLVAEWPAAIGRALGELLFMGKLGPLALSKAGDFAIAGTPAARGAAAALGLAIGLTTGVTFFRLALRSQPTRVILFVLAGCAAIAAFVPPAASAVSLAELGAAIGLSLLALWRDDATPQLGVQFLAGVIITAPFAALRPVFLSLGHATGEVGILEAVTGLPGLAWGILATGAALGALALLPSGEPTRDKPAKVRPA